MNLRAALFLMAALLFPQNAFACECAEMTPERSRAIIESAELIFEGTVMALDQPEQPEENADFTLPIPQNPLYAKARLKITTPYKGGAAGERVEAFFATITSCGHLFEPGDTALFLLTRQDDILVQADICSDPLPAHWEEMIAQ